MQGTYYDNLDLDITITKAEIASLKRKKKKIQTDSGTRFEYEYPVLEGILLDENDNKIGLVKLRAVKERDVTSTPQKRGVYFFKTEPNEWELGLSQAAENELKDHDYLTRRMPSTQAQFWIYTQE
ncbi:hypothetical protein KY346_06650 [Candidatus Woesearchaeota archaeon]|nr:hypothetical protein [Candidatus Woesearchaeota archaeon]